MTEYDREKILALWENGMPLLQIRQMVAMTEEDFRRAIAQMKRNGDFPKVRANSFDRVVAACKAGETNPYVLAETYGLSLKTAKEYRRKSGEFSGKRPKRNYKHCDRTNAINAALQNRDATVAEIAREFGVSWTYVKKLKKKLEEDENG